MTRISSIILNKSGKNRQPYFLPALEENIHSIIIKCDVSCRCFVDVLYQVDEVPSIPLLMSVLIINENRILSNAFSMSNDTIM